MRNPARIRTSGRFLLRSLDRRASSFLLALLAVVVGVSIAATGLALRADLGRKMSRELRAYGPNLLARPAASAADERQSAGGVPLLDEAVVQSLRTRATSGLEVCPMLYAVGRTAVGGVTVVGTDLDAARRMFPFWKVEGTWPAGAPEAGDIELCVVGARLASRLHAVPGSRLQLAVGAADTLVLHVAALVASGEAEEEQLLVRLPLLQRVTGREGRISVAALRDDGHEGRIEETARRLQAAAPGLEVEPLRQVSQAEGRFLERLDGMLVLLGGLVLVMSGLCVMTTLISAVVEREPEIGLMRALGSGDTEIAFMLLGEATLLGVLGGLLGFGLGALCARLLGTRLFGAAIDARPEVIPLVVGLAIALTWAGTIVPLRRALSIQPADALRGE